eukprot:TRINITY_DN5165_c0_g1_i1.p1 TRINITY_DN5165_c0_g1~~TRINITY_DN5165_c0_g1_i1.p1  ORF type:complete len:215 (+),score=30.34 TRINITY_DN5165_c0_g1_i1:77-721(+)
MALNMMAMTVDDMFPGVLNQRSMANVRRTYDVYMNGADLGITVIGESVAAKIGMLWKDQVSRDITLDEGEVYPGTEVFNLGHTGHTCISYFLCLIEDDYYHYDRCDQFESPVPEEVMRSFEATKPHLVAIHDQHWAFSNVNKEDNFELTEDIDRFLAFNMMTMNAVENGVKEMIFMTFSSSDWETNRLHPPQYWMRWTAFYKKEKSTELTWPLV